MSVESRKAQVDALFSEWAKSESPGCAVAILQGDEVVYKQGYGMANLEYNVPITPATIFHVASVSKQFVAAAIALLEQDGKLSSTDDIRKYLPELHDFGETITIQHLAHHTSGLRDQWELLVLAGWRMEDVITTDDILELIRAQRALNFKPGAEFSYSNTGYTLLGLIVQRVSDKTLRQFCHERIFAPLGMTSTHFHDDYQELVANRAYSYQKRDSGFQHAHLLYSTVGASSLFTTAEDLLRWESNFFNLRVGDQAFIERMTRRDPLNDGDPLPYAFGVIVREYRGLRIVEHSGGDAGFRSHLLQFPDQRFAVTVLSNLASVRPGQLTQQIADIYLADVFTVQPEPAVKLTPAQLELRAGYYHDARRHETLQLTYDLAREALMIWSAYALEAQDERHFRLFNMRFEFAESPVGQLLIDDGSGRPAIYQHIDPVTPASLDEYTGVYHCPELDVKYSFSVEDGKLMLRRRKYGSAALLPLFGDAFAEASTEYDLLFKRSSAGAITGFELTNGRVRSLWFERQAAP